MGFPQQSSKPFGDLPVIQPSESRVGEEASQRWGDTERVVLQVVGMHCAGCVSQVEQALAKVPGVVEARVNLATGNAAVACRPGADRAAMTDAVRSVGFDAAVSDTDYRQQLRVAQSAAEVELGRWRWRFWEGLLWLALLMGLHWINPVTRGVAGIDLTLVQLLVATLLIARVGMPYLAGAIRLLRRGRANMDTLIAVGSFTAYLYGLYLIVTFAPGAMHFMDMGMILVFVTLGRYLELRARGRMSGAIYDLMALTPDVVLVQNGSEIRAVALEHVQRGQHCVVRPGDRIPLDGTIVQGDSRIDASWLTGEAHKLPKTVGDEVQAGSLNGDGALVIRVDRVSSDSTIARVTRLVQHAQESKAGVQRLADRLAAWFVPVVLLLALVTFGAWWVATSWQTALSFAVAVTVVSCPCALGLATPTAIIAAVHAAARRGVLIKNAQALETAHRASAIVFDKTGTITHGPPLVHAIETVHVTEEEAGVDSEDASEEVPPWFWVAAALERHSSHPLAAAICDYADKHRGAQPSVFPSVARIVSLPGEGMSGMWGTQQVYVGSETLLRRLAIPLRAAPADATADTARDTLTNTATHTKASGSATRNQIAYVAIDGRHVGTVHIITMVDPQAHQVVAELKKLGLLTAILTGDRASSAQHVAEITGVDRVDSDATPEDKYRQIKSLQTAGHVVAMVGDGINDAAGLALADLGIAMGAGADVALESADIVLVHSQLQPVVFVVRLARRTWATIRMNLVWALFYNVLLIPVAAGLLVPLGGFTLPPAWAAAAMAASSITVVLNSLRLARFE